MGKIKLKEDMSNIFFLYTKNDIIYIGDNMVKQGNISDRDLPVVLEIIREVFSHIPQNTTISKEANNCCTLN